MCLNVLILPVWTRLDVFDVGRSLLVRTVCTVLKDAYNDSFFSLCKTFNTNFWKSNLPLIPHSEHLLAGVFVPHRETMRSSVRNTLFLTEERGLSRCGRKG